MERRAEDRRVSQLVLDVAALKEQMTENTEITRQVKDILGSFRILYKVAKWIVAIGTAVAALYHGVAFIRNQ